MEVDIRALVEEQLQEPEEEDILPDDTTQVGDWA